MDGFRHTGKLDHFVDDLWNHLMIEDEAEELAVFVNIPLFVVAYFTHLNGEGAVFVGERIVHSGSELEGAVGVDESADCSGASLVVEGFSFDVPIFFVVLIDDDVSFVAQTVDDLIEAVAVLSDMKIVVVETSSAVLNDVHCFVS